MTMFRDHRIEARTAGLRRLVAELHSASITALEPSMVMMAWASDTIPTSGLSTAFLRVHDMARSRRF